MRYTAGDKERLLEAYKVSGLSACAFASQAGISKGTFYNWVVRAQLTKPRVRLAQVVRVERPSERAPEALQRSAICIAAGAFRIELTPGFDTSMLAQVLDVLAARDRTTR